MREDSNGMLWFENKQELNKYVKEQRFTVPKNVDDDLQYFVKEYVRPWGIYEEYVDNERATVKVMSLRPRTQLSLQLHFKRDQVYIALSDNLTYLMSEYQFEENVTEEEIKNKYILNARKLMYTHAGKFLQVFFIKRRTLHRVTNNSDKHGYFLDIAIGENDEKDIVRVEDSYGRESYE